ncbi:MAG: hypothetical protein AB7V39_04910 [Nitrospiraceae bacterium]
MRQDVAILNVIDQSLNEAIVECGRECCIGRVLRDPLVNEFDKAAHLGAWVWVMERSVGFLLVDVDGDGRDEIFEPSPSHDGSSDIL